MSGRALLSISLAVGLLATASNVAGQQLFDPVKGACPAGDYTYAPLDAHFEPGFVEHRNWLDFPAPTHVAAQVAYFLCVDDRIVDVGLRGTVENVYRISVTTRWVDWQWATGRLRGYGDLARWRIAVVRCDTVERCRLLQPSPNPDAS